jgi:lycopene beta-cyclase
MSSNASFDLILLGAGLSNGLIAHLLMKRLPELKVAIVEKGRHAGGNHTWCFQETALTRSYQDILDHFITYRWNGYDVQFQKYGRTLDEPYYAVSSTRFHDSLLSEISKNPLFQLCLGEEVASVLSPGPGKADATRVHLKSGMTIQAPVVIDGRGLTQRELNLKPGFQKFVGLELELDKPSPCLRPLIMDATVPQLDGYRFMYVLPFTGHSVLIEDTYYSNGPSLDVEKIRKEILSYAKAHGYSVKRVIREEKGCLPIPVSPLNLSEENPLPRSGLLAGFFHPTTGYSFLEALRFADWVTRQNFKSAETFEKSYREYADARLEEAGYYYFLNKMMFLCTPPETRFRIFERFYTLDAGLIHRFYTLGFSQKDKVRMLTGKPPFWPNSFMAKNIYLSLMKKPLLEAGSANDSYHS